MIQFMQMFLVIILGFATAYIDWENLFKILVPRWEKIRNTPQLMGCLALTLVSYYLFVYIPSGILVDSIEKRQKMLMQTERRVTLKQISYRQVVERRASWPLAYKNVVMKE